MVLQELSRTILRELRRLMSTWLLEISFRHFPIFHDLVCQGVWSPQRRHRVYPILLLLACKCSGVDVDIDDQRTDAMSTVIYRGWLNDIVVQWTVRRYQLLLLEPLLSTNLQSDKIELCKWYLYTKNLTARVRPPPPPPQRYWSNRVNSPNHNLRKATNGTKPRRKNVRIRHGLTVRHKIVPHFYNNNDSTQANDESKTDGNSCFHFPANMLTAPLLDCFQ